MEHLRDILINQFLTAEYSDCKFVAWNANNFDAYFVAAALVECDEYLIRPYLTKSNALRGLRICLKSDIDENGKLKKDGLSWEFLDGIAVLGLAGTTLAKFLKNFAPDYCKHEGVINFEKETFNPKNKAHQEYAMRDSVGLYWGMVRAQSIIVDTFNQNLTVTMGGACIKIFQNQMPEKVKVPSLNPAPLNHVRDYVMRGGYCYCVKPYKGKVWKYDLNQAYAAAMREAQLPAGYCHHTEKGINRFAKVFFVRVTATNEKNKIPFYYRTIIDGRLKSVFADTQIKDTWITSIEYNQLKDEGWKITVFESYFFESSFNMADFVNNLETLRTTCEGGPSGPIGTMVKAVGNHSYGKTVEVLDYVDYLLSKDLPPGYMPLYPPGECDPLEHIYYRFTPDDEIRLKNYHKPQIGAFITAYVRMTVRRAALLSPDTWLYADTDCVMFSEDVTARLDCDPKRYGAWKIEEQGTDFLIIGKKIYQNLDTKVGHAKGLNVKRLTNDDFLNWFDGSPPAQDQVQKNNFLSVMRGAEMFRSQKRSGTRADRKNQLANT